MIPSDQAGKASPSVSWSQLVRIFWRQYIGLGVLMVLLVMSEGLVPYRHVLYNSSDNELWRYSYPLRVNTVPPWAVPTVAILAPLSIITAFLLTGKISNLEAHHAGISALTCIMFTGITTNFIKVNVGRFRPHFVARCWPDGGKPIYEIDGRPKCSDQAVNPLEGMKSFPSGHTAWSTAGLAYTSFWLMGKTGCFNGGGPLRLAMSLLPLGGAVWIGASRMQDYWHHWEDVTVGFALGLMSAWLFYRTAYNGVMSGQAGSLVAGLSAGPTPGSAGYVARQVSRWQSTQDAYPDVDDKV